MTVRTAQQLRDLRNPNGPTYPLDHETWLRDLVDSMANAADMPGLIVTSRASQPTRRIFAIHGDSRAAQGVQLQINTPSPPYRAINRLRHGIGSWLQFLSYGRIRSPMTYTQAISGSGTASLAGQLATSLALLPKPTDAYLLTGTNDFGNSVAIATIKANLIAYWQACQVAGIQVWEVLDLPRALSSWSATPAAQSHDFNQWLRDNAPGYGVILIDPVFAIADPASSSGDPLSTMVQTDGIHPLPLTAFTVDSIAVSQIFGSLNLGSPLHVGSRGDAYDATNNPHGNLIPSGFGVIQGNSGTNTSTAGTASGTVAAGWNSRTLTGANCTAVASLVARPDGQQGQWQRLVITDNNNVGGSTGRFSLVTPIAPANGYTSPDLLYGAMGLKVSGATGLQLAQLNCFDFGTGNQSQSIDGKITTIISTTYPLPNAFGQGLMLTDPVAISAGSTNFHFRFEWQLAQNGSATLDFGDMEVRKVLAA